MKAALVWLRRDLRLDDHPALEAATKTKLPVLPVYCFDSSERSWQEGGASKWWLHRSLESLEKDFKSLGSKLFFVKGRPEEKLPEICKELEACLFYNRHYSPSEIESEKNLDQALEKSGIASQSFRGNLLWEPGSVRTQQGEVYKVYTPFWKASTSKSEPAKPIEKPTKLKKPPKLSFKPCELKDFKLLPKIRWYESLEDQWTPGIEGARNNLMAFSKRCFKSYTKDRDFPAQRGTSELSPHLHFGEISVRRIWYYLRKKITKAEIKKNQFLKELAWRDFAYHLLVEFPWLPDEPLKQEYKKFPWKQDSKKFKLWTRGQTGYPIVDAGMRQLWKTGWMHNRVRMIVASFLVKDLLIPWEDGAAWFWDTLVDADLASNTLGWQWAAGCGPDAAPYFRIFNPILQGKRFDPQGDYVRKWVPELEAVPTKYIHEPWKLPEFEAKELNFKVGRNYSACIVDHFEARDAALKAYNKIKKAS